MKHFIFFIVVALFLLSTEAFASDFSEERANLQSLRQRVLANNLLPFNTKLGQEKIETTNQNKLPDVIKLDDPKNQNSLLAQSVPSATKDIQERMESLEKELAELKVILEEKKKLAEKEKKESDGYVLNLNHDTMLKLAGFVQMRAYDSQTGTSTHKSRTDLDLRRVRVALSGDIGKKIFLQYSFDVGRNGPSTRDAFFDYRFTPWFLVRSGQFKLPIGYEVLLSGSDVIFERALDTLRLFPNVRDRGFMWDADLSRFIHIPLSFQFGVVNGTGIGQVDNNGAKDVFTSLLYKTKLFDARAFFQSGRYDFVPKGKAETTTHKQRTCLSLHSNFGFGKEKLWESYGNYTIGHGDFPLGKYELTGEFGTTEDFNNNDVSGYNIVLTRRLYKDSPITLWGKYDRFDPNTHVSGNTIDIIAYGTKVDLNKNLSVLGGVFHKDFRNLGKDVSLGLQTQLKY